jgi:hypothetical protein
MYDENSFTALDKLMSFAQGQTIQMQMTQTMNAAIANMRIPGAGNPIPQTENPDMRKREPPYED